MIILDASTNMHIFISRPNHQNKQAKALGPHPGIIGSPGTSMIGGENSDNILRSLHVHHATCTPAHILHPPPHLRRHAGKCDSPKCSSAYLFNELH